MGDFNIPFLYTCAFYMLYNKCIIFLKNEKNNMKHFIVSECKKVLNKTKQIKQENKHINEGGYGEWAEEPIEIAINGQSWKFWATK